MSSTDRFLVGEILRMLEGQQEEESQLLRRRSRSWPAASALRAKRRASGSVANICAGAAKAVARKLVEQDHQRQRAFGMVDPVRRARARAACEVQVAEAVVEVGVERLVLAEPGVLARVPPELHDFGRARIDLSHVCSVN